MVKATNIEVSLTLDDKATAHLQKFEKELGDTGREGKQAFDKLSKEAKQAGEAISKASGRARDARGRFVKLGQDGSGAMEKVDRSAKGVGKSTGRAGERARSTRGRFVKLGRDGKKAMDKVDRSTKKASLSMGKLALGLGVAFAAFKAFQIAGRTGLGFIRDAAKFEEDVAKFSVVFGEESLRVAQQLDELSGAVKRSKGELIDFASGFQDIFVPLGFARDDAADLSVQLTKLAIDVGSFNNKMDADVIVDFKSALVGNSETVRKYGILIDEARIKQTAYNLGITKAGEKVTAQQKVIARYNILMADTSDALGDAERTSGSFANTIKGLQAVASDLGIVFGQELQQVVLKNIKAMGGLDGVADTIKVAFAAVTTATESMIDAVGTAGAAFKTFIDGLGGADKVVGLIRGELDLTTEAGAEFAKGFAKIGGIMAAAFKVMESGARVAGAKIAQGFFMALGLDFEREALLFSIKFKDHFSLDNLLSGGLLPSFGPGGTLGALAGAEDAGAAAVADLAKSIAAQGPLMASTIEKGLNEGLAGVELDTARLVFALDRSGISSLIRRDLMLEGVEDVAGDSKKRLEIIFNELVDVGAKVTKTKGRKGIKFSEAFRADPGDFPKIIEVLTKHLNPEAIQNAIRDMFSRVKGANVERLVLRTSELIDISLDERELEADKKALQLLIGSALGDIGGGIDQMIGDAKARELNIADFIFVGESKEAFESEVAVLVGLLNAEFAAGLEFGVDEGAVQQFRHALDDLLIEATAAGTHLPGELLGDLLMAVESLDLGSEFREALLALKEEAAPAGTESGEVLGSALVAAAKAAVKGLSAELRIVTEEVKAGLVSDFAAFELGIQVKIEKVGADEALTDEQRERAVAALNAQLGMEERTRTAAQAAAMRQLESDEARESLASKLTGVLIAQLIPMGEAVIAQEQLLEAQERIAGLKVDIGIGLDSAAIEAAAEAAVMLAEANAGQSAEAQRLLREEIDLIFLKRDATLEAIAAKEREAAVQQVFTKLLSDEELGLKLRNDLAASFENAIGGVARSFVDAEFSWAAFRDQFLMGIAQMITQALLLASIKALLGNSALGTFLFPEKAMGGVVEGVGSMATGDAPGYATGGVHAGAMESHSGLVRAFAGGGVLDGIDSGGLPVHQYSAGGIARTPQLAVFGEGRGAEAFVPLPDGKSIPVKMDGGDRPVNITLTVASLDPRTAADVVLAQMPSIRKELGAALREGTDRSLIEGVRGAARR